MSIEEIYTALNGNYADAKIRLMNDRLIEKFLRKFPNDPTMEELLKAIEAGDRELSFRMAHTMKGVAANMAFTELKDAASALTEHLRPLDKDADPTLLDAVKASYQTCIETIKRLDE